MLPNYFGDEAQTVEFTKGETYYFDTKVFSAEKNGHTLSITSVTMNGVSYTYGDKIALTEGGVYDIVYAVVDPYNFNSDASATTTVTHNVSVTVTAIVKDAAVLAPKFTFIDQNGNNYQSTTVKVGEKTYVMPDVAAADPTSSSMEDINIGSASISGTTVYFPVAEGYTIKDGSNFNRYYPLFNGINITDYTVAGDTTGTTYNSSGNYTSLVGSDINSKFIIPEKSGQTNCGDYVETDGQSGNPAGNSDSGWQGAGYSTKYSGTYLKSGNTSAARGSDTNGYERIVWVEYSFNAGNGDVYYYRIGYHCNEVEANNSCVTPDTLVTLADGSKKRIDEVTYNDQLLVWDFFNGEYTVMPSALVVNHGYDEWTVIELSFDDGTSVKAITAHSFFDKNTNAWELIDAQNAKGYIGHFFIKATDTGYTSAKLVAVDVYEEYTESYSLVSAVHYNFITNDLFSLTNSVSGMLAGLEVGDNMMYDKTVLAEDIEKFGTYTYADFEKYISYEQYLAFNGDYLKISVEKGKIEFEEILKLIDLYL